MAKNVHNACIYLYISIFLYLYGVVAANDLEYIPGRSIKVDACNLNVRVITNSGHCNSMMDRLISSA